jgi:hypothetical protein
MAMARDRFGSWAAFLAAIFLATTAHAVGDVQVSGYHIDDETTATFSCSGAPTCTGVYTSVDRYPECNNTSFTFTGTFIVNGLTITQPGNFSGTIFLQGGDTNTHVVNGVCSPVYSDITFPYTGTWDGRNGVLRISTQDGIFDFPFTASVSTAPPVFPMGVTSSITPTVASATAAIQPRPQDVGQNVGIFVFAHAPASKVRGAKRSGPANPIPVLRRDEPDPCVLAQVDSSGNLFSVTAGTMQAAVTGTLSAQGQSVSVLNNVATPNVAGATMYVGYGANASTMLANGVFQGAVTVPGAATCTAALATSAKADSPSALTGLWWNANESGWGIHFTQRRNIVFAAWYTYDATGGPKWYVVPSCALPAGVTGSSGTCTGSLYEVNGPRFFGTTFTPPTASQVTAAGTVSIAFQNANTGSMQYTVGAQTRTVPIVRAEFGSGLVPPAVDFTDIWWNPSESGWGAAIAHRFGIIFLAWYVYDAAGKPVWYVVPNCPLAGNACTGAAYRTTGPPFGPTFDPTRVASFAVGSVTLGFTDANNATLSYTVNGVSATKSITRNAF